MDKGWISLPRWHPAYIPGVKDFVKYACGINPNSNEIMCPCKKCRNVKLVKKEVLGEHLMIDGFLPSYTCWIFHGEFVASPVARTEDKGQSDSYEGDEMHELLYDAFGIPPFAPPTDDTTGSSSNYGPDEKTKKFFSLLKEAERELYPGCSKFSTLSFIVRLLHIKTLSGWTDKSFTMLLELLKEAFPEGDTLPKSFYATRVLLKDLGLDYHKVDACPKDCSLYWKDTADRENCIVCHHPRYKQFEKEQTHIFQAQMQEQFQLYRVQFETQMKEMMETQMAAMRTQMDATIQAQAATIQTQQTRMEYLESQLVTRGGLAAREAAWGHHPMSRSQQNSHEFTSSSSHQKVAQSKTKNKSKSKRRPHI